MNFNPEDPRNLKKIFNSRSLDFIPVKFWKKRDISLSDFLNLLKNSNIPPKFQSKDINLKFNHKLWCVLQISVIDTSFFDLFGVQWKSNTDLIIEVDTAIISKIIENLTQENIQQFFKSNGWQRIIDNDISNLLFTIDPDNCLNTDFFDIEFYQTLIKNSNDERIYKISSLISSNFCSLLQSDKIEKNINYISKYSDTITIDETVSDDSILDDIVHFITFPGKISFEQTETKSKKVVAFNQNMKKQLLFDESSLEQNHDRIKLLLELPPAINYHLFPSSNEFSQSMAIINGLIVFSEKFKRLLFESLFENIQKVKDDRGFFEVISVLLIMIKSHQFDVRSFKPIFMSPLFDDYATVYNYSEDYQKLLYLREQWIHIAFGFNENLMIVFPRKFTFYKDIFHDLRKHPIGFSEFTLIISKNFSKLITESQNYLMLLMAQTNVYFFICMKSILEKIYHTNGSALDRHFYYQQIMNVRKLNKFDYSAQFYENYNLMDIEDRKKVSAIIQARFSIHLFFYKNFKEIFKKEEGQLSLNAYQYKTFKLILSSFFEISLQEQILSLIDLKDEFNDFSLFDQISQIYLQTFTTKVNDIITINFCDNLIRFLHNKIYNILKNDSIEKVENNQWIHFLYRLFPNIICWYTLIDTSFIPIDMIQLSICNTLSFITTCLSLSKDDHLHESFEILFNSLFSDIENICLYYFMNSETCRDLLFKYLINLAAENELNSFYGYFAIKYGKAIRILVKIFFVKSTFEYLNNICYMNIRNCHQLSLSEVDTILIEYLHANRNNRNEENKDLFLSVFQLFKTIAYQHTSVNCVTKFISIFSPIKGSLLPYYLPLFVNMLSELSIHEQKFPILSIPLLMHSCNLNVSNIDSELFNEGVSFSFWIFINKKITQQKAILTIKQKTELKEKKIVLYINPNYKLSLSTHDDNSYLGPTREPISEGKWHFIMISFQFRSKDLKVKFLTRDEPLYSFNDKKPNDDVNKIIHSNDNLLANARMSMTDLHGFAQFFNFTKFEPNTKFQIFIGGEDNTNYFNINSNNSNNNNNNESEEECQHIQSEDLASSSINDVFLGPIGMFPLKENKAYLFYMFNSSHEIPSKAYFYAYPQSLDTDVVSFKFESKQFNSVTYPVQQEFYTSFINVMVKNNLFTKLIPLFGLNDLRAKSDTIRIPSANKSYMFDNADDHYYFDYTNAAIEIFRNIFTIFEEAQNDLMKISGFHVIEHLLVTTIDDTFNINEIIEKGMRSVSLDFFLYRNFVALLESITNKNAQYQLLNDILFNFELWIRSKDIDMILNHWYMSLIPDFFTEFFNKYSIVSLLTILRLYLYFEPKEKSIIISDRKIGIEKVKFCRKIIWSIIASSDRFSQLDLSTLVSHSTSCPDFQHVEEIVDFMIYFFNNKFKSDGDCNKDSDIKRTVPRQKKKFIRLFHDANKSQTTNITSQSIKLNNPDLQDYESILQMNLLTSCPNQDIIKKVLILFIKLYQMQILNKSSFAENFELIGMNMPILKNPKEFLDELLDYFCPEILNIYFIIALQTNSIESVTKIVEKMKTVENPESFYCSENCFFWPIVTCFLFRHCHEEIIDILQNCPPSSWPIIYNTMVVVGDILNKNSRNIRHYFLTAVSTQICLSYDDTKLEIFFIIVFHFFFIKYKKKTFEIPEFSTYEITKAILSISDFYESSYFDIDLDSSECMIEADLAQVALSLFEKKHSKTYSDFIVIICAHQLPFEFLPLDKFKKYNCISKSEVFYYYDTIAISLGRDLLTNEDQQKIYMNQVEFKQKFTTKYEQFFSTVNASKFLISLQSNLNNIDLKFRMFLNEKFNNISTDLFRKYIEYNSMIELSYEKQWKVYWSSNSYEKKALFHYQIHSDNVHFIRDYSSCYGYCPFKLSYNKNFNDHLKESLFRDSGNIEKAQSQYNQIKSEEKEKKKEANHGLFLYDEYDDFNPEIQQNLDSINSEETVIFHTEDCERRKPNKNLKTNFFITKDKLIIGRHFIPFQNIESIFMRFIRHHQTAIEIFETNGNSYFLNFPKIENSFTIISKIQQATQNLHPTQNYPLKTINFQSTCSNRFFFESKLFTEKWVNGLLSNFDYLMVLNIYSGRTFNDAMLYPVMPWIIQDYDSEELNLHDEKTFRDLSLPIGAVNEKRFNMLFNSFKRSTNPESAFLYSSWLVCPLSLYVWLVRMEPFTTNHVVIQGGRFDVEQRIFRSIKSSYKLCTNDNNDFRELVPEFFFQPEFLINANKFDLGQEGTGDVELPKWSKSSFDFIYKHRKALESEIVSKSLNRWIDLTFGCKQRSEEDKNIYRSELYSDVWETEFGMKPQNEDQICCSLDLLGQIPQPLFTNPHPEKKILSKEEQLKNCEDKWPSNEYDLSFEKNVDLIDLNRERSVIDRKIIMHSIVDRQVDTESDAVSYILHLYCLEFKKIDGSEKLNALTYLLKYEMKPNSIDFLSSSLLLVESVDSCTNRLAVASENIKDVSQFGFVITMGNSIYLTFNLLSTNETQQMKFIVQEGICCSLEEVAVSSKYLAAFNINSNTLFVFMKKKKVANESLFSVCVDNYTTEKVVSIVLSDEFNLCVCATKSMLILVSINKMEIERTIQLADYEIEKPLKILISQSWGFITVLTATSNDEKPEFYLSLFNVNGYFIGKSGKFELDTSHSVSSLNDDSKLNKICGLTEKVDIKWLSWKTVDGFDFILIADSHSVYSFEAFNIESAPGKPILTFPNEIIGFYFIKEAKKAVITLDNGKVVVKSILKFL